MTEPTSRHYRIDTILRDWSQDPNLPEIVKRVRATAKTYRMVGMVGMVGLRRFTPWVSARTRGVESGTRRTPAPGVGAQTVDVCLKHQLVMEEMMARSVW